MPANRGIAFLWSATRDYFAITWAIAKSFCWVVSRHQNMLSLCSEFLESV